ncbi:MAG: tRNA lysidine(34) synthetase TilS [Planctomycetota bacterium]|jgi:tRNA(Ile)-lysidine synthase|nr:tRNA lysidine(34) synthetase TilS [Planctomycetota bacterium]
MRDAFAEAMARILARAGGPGRIIAALSGGIDSVVLLHLLSRWRAGRKGGPEIIAAHLDHGWRGEAAREDREFSRRLAEGLAFAFAGREAGAAGAAGPGREEAGRRLRLLFFADLAGADGAIALTGHQADDQIETILLQLRRGAHRRGLAGMDEFTRLAVPPGRTIEVGRPLLGFRRAEIAAYARKERLEWREDASNRDPAFARNRIRNRTLPILEALLPGFGSRLLVRAARLAREEAELAGQGRELAGRLAREEAGGRFFRLPEAAFRRPEALVYALRLVLEEETALRLPNRRTLAGLFRLAEAGKPGESLNLPGRFRAVREPEGIFFSPPAEAAPPRPEGIILPDPPFSLPVSGLAVTAEWLPSPGRPPEADARNPEAEWFDPAALRWPLRLRPPRPGERFRPLGAPGSRKIQDILVDLKIPRSRRRLPLVLADREGAVWLWPCRLAERVKLAGPLAQALRVEIRAGKAAR